jgi:putative ABC transport system permease protein
MDPEMTLMGMSSLGLRVEGDPRRETDLPAARSMRAVSPDYFRTLAIPLIAGRVFQDADGFDALPVTIVNRGLAKSIWGDADPVGKRISFDGGRMWWRIVGMVGDTREFGLAQEPPNQVYLPITQNPWLETVLVRMAGEGPGVPESLRRAVLEIDPQIAIANTETLDQARANSVSSPRNTTRLFGLFAVLAFLIAVTGVGSMLALWVRQRTREIGIRIALGATPRDILGGVIRQGMLLVLTGLAIGFGGAVCLTRFLRDFLFQVAPTDTATYGLVSFLLLAAALAACYAPARRAAQIDPQSALRSE